MRRIAIVTPIFPVAQDRTRGRFTYETAKALSQLARVRVYIQQPDYPRLSGRAAAGTGLLPHDYAHEGLDVEAVSYPAVPGLTRGINGWTGGRRLLAHVREFQPEVLLGYWVYPDGYAALHAARKLGVPAVIGALGSDIHLQKGVSARLSRHTLQQADAVIAVSEAMRQSVIHEYGASASQVHTIVNGFNTGVFFAQPQAEMRAKLGVAADAKLIIYVGRLIEAKGLRELITAFAQMAVSDAKAYLVLVGNGPFKDVLSSEVAKHGLDKRVTFTGGLEPRLVADWIGAADLLTLPSWSEGYPNVLVEALACGRPVVATQVGGIPEIINASNGRFVPARDAGALRAALQDALQRSWDHAAIAASMRRTWLDVGRETLAVCEDAIQRAREARRPPAR